MVKICIIFILLLSLGFIHAEDSLLICLFWNRSVNSIVIFPIADTLIVNGNAITTSDTLKFTTGENFFAQSNGEFAISDGTTERMVKGIAFGSVGGKVFAKIALDDWVLLTLLGEFPETNSIEALCAGAIVLRSFALAGKHHSDCDLCDRTHCALIPEPQPIPQKFIEAVDRTKDLVLTYDDRIISATFSANCGGQTISAEIVWGNQCEWSVAVHDTFCNPEHWQFSTDKAILDTIFPLPVDEWIIFGDSIAFVGHFDNLNDRFRSVPFPEPVEGSLSNGKIAKFALWDTLFNIFGWGTLKSPGFALSIDGDSVIFTGVGFGHRVGLCQNGAAQMAKKGKTFEEILQFYFPKAIIQRRER